MNFKEASEFANAIKPSIVVPIHYGSIVGTNQDAINFKELIKFNIQCKFLIK